MKRILLYTTLALSSFSFLTSCTKEIDVNFDDAPVKVVIQGKINNESSAEVYVSKTIEVDKVGNNPPVSNAIVTMSDNAGNTETLTEVSPGKYVTNSMTGVEGRTYNLTVVVDGVTYTSTSTMPTLIPVDSLSTREFDGFGGEAAKFVVVHYQDPIAVGNNYRAVLYINDTLVPDIFIEDDLYINGNTREAVLFSDEYELKKGDKIVAEINCLDRPAFEYLVELVDVNGNSEVAAPANPTSNITGGALGYFSAQTSSIMEMTAD
ncbi:MAG: DUF4249 domain-containing protein [Chitinophagales bacterium]|nr:DUF4249 domain-containing protein [Chitinophagaceae bacterium]MCB9065830.1 DUF4249 domain-containing protein [Chitinophagales bacterium]